MKKKPISALIYTAMRLMIVQATLSIAFAFSTIASNADAQTILDKTVTIHAENKEIKTILNFIQKQTNVKFIFGSRAIQAGRKISVSVDDQKLSDFIQSVLNPLSIGFRIVDGQILLYPVELPKQTMPDNQYPLAATVPGKMERTITGNITDEKGEALKAASIIVKGTNRGTISDDNGNFKLTLQDNDSILVISITGYATKQIGITNNSFYKVALNQLVKGLNDVVVIGYGTVRKSDLTGAVSSLKPDEFNKGVIIAPQQLMQGKIAGVNISLNSGEPGANSTVLIRGGTSISASNRPLYVIDGVPVDYVENDYATGSNYQPPPAQNPLNLLNPSDIKSIDVLKDASATAIYGSRGANGVILITTKRGIAGKDIVEYDGYVSSSSLRKKFDVLSAPALRSFVSRRPDVPAFKDGGANTDMQDQIFRTGVGQSHNLAFSGGDNKTNYRASVNYSNQDGIIKNSFLQKIVGRVNVTHKSLNDRLNLLINLTGAQLNEENAPVAQGSNGGGSGSLIRDALRWNPTNPIKDSSGKYFLVDQFHGNPVEELNTIKNRNETFRFLSNMIVDYKLTDFLSVNANIGFTKEFTDNLFYVNRASYELASGTNGFASQEQRNNSSKLLETNLVFNKALGEKQFLNVIGGYSYQEFFNVDNYFSASGFISDATSYNNIGAGDRNTWNINSYKQSNKLISFYGRANYQYNNKYLLTITVRRDGSDRFGVNNRWGTFPSAALAWKVSEENFLKDNNLLSNLKLRISYGVTGNQDIGDYLALKTLSAGNTSYIIGGSSYIAVGPTSNPNPNLKWESTAQSNLGLDFGFFKNRLTGSVDYYDKQTSDLLLTFAVPSPAEVTYTTANVGKVSNKGVELELKGTLIDGGAFRWEVYGNIAHNKNNVVTLSNNLFQTKQIFTGSPQAPGFTSVATQVIQPGQPLGTFYGPIYTGPAKDSTESFITRTVNGTTSVVDTVIDNHQPDFTYGFGSSLSYKRFSFDFSFYGIKGNKVLNATQLDLENLSNLPLANIASSTTTAGLKYGVAPSYSSRWIQNATFLRLENVTLGYDINVASLKWLSRARIYVTGQNLFVITPYSGFDPEVSTGTDYTKYPRPRTVLLGISIQF